MDYDSADISDVKADLQKWKDQVEPILGSVDVFAFAKESEFGSYSGEKFDALMSAGFRYYLGFNFQDTAITIGGRLRCSSMLASNGSLEPSNNMPSICLVMIKSIKVFSC